MRILLLYFFILIQLSVTFAFPLADEVPSYINPFTPNADDFLEWKRAAEIKRNASSTTPRAPTSSELTTPERKIHQTIVDALTKVRNKLLHNNKIKNNKAKIDTSERSSKMTSKISNDAKFEEVKLEIFIIANEIAKSEKSRRRLMKAQIKARIPEMRNEEADQMVNDAMYPVNFNYKAMSRDVSKIFFRNTRNNLIRRLALLRAQNGH